MSLCKRIIDFLPLLALCGGTNAFAADPPPDQSNPPQQQTSSTTDTTQTLGMIYVTGTHIRSVDLETQHPLLVLKREDLLRTGLTDIAQIVQNIVVNGQTQNRNVNNGNDGRELVDLRSLGPNRTLVLVNGQRWVSALDGAVDLSAIPMALVERVEVLKDGASAIYGSDAIAGVVNIITRRDFKGAELGAYYGETDHGDGIRRDVDFSYGRSGERWTASFGVEYAKDDPVFADARQISSLPVAGLPLAATGSPFMQFRRLDPQTLNYSRYTLIAGRSGTSPDDFRPFDFATDPNINYTPYFYLQTPLERKAIFVQGRYEPTPNLALSTAADPRSDCRRQGSSSEHSVARTFLRQPSTSRRTTSTTLSVWPLLLFSGCFSRTLRSASSRPWAPHANTWASMVCSISLATRFPGVRMSRICARTNANPSVPSKTTRNCSSRSVLRSSMPMAWRAAVRPAM